MNKYLNNLEDEIRCDYLVKAKQKRVWQKELEILVKIQEICKKYNITYFAEGGTLLGAVRHKGFIPWDDDIDISMRRDDYNRFLEIAKKEIKYPLFVQSFETERRFAFDMIKIRNTETTAYTPNEACNECNKGIFVDIFPVDNEPDDDSIRKKENLNTFKELRRIDRMTRLSAPSSNKLKTFLSKFIKSLARLFYSEESKKKDINKVIENSKKYNNIQTEYCGCRTFMPAPGKFRWKNKYYAGGGY